MWHVPIWDLIPGHLSLKNGSRPAYSQECLPKAQAILKGFDYNIITSF
jgi:hypothetical protein